MGASDKGGLNIILFNPFAKGRRGMTQVNKLTFELLSIPDLYTIFFGKLCGG